MSEERSMSFEQLLEHRLSLASKYLKWTPIRISAFRAGFSDARAACIDRERLHQHDGGLHGFRESELTRELIASLGYRDGVRAVDSLACSPASYRGDQALLRQIAAAWSANGNGDFDIDTASWTDTPAADLERFLRIMPREQWVAWFVAEHVAALRDGRDGYGDLLMQDVREHVVYVEYDEDKLDIWDGWHRIGAAMLKRAGQVPAICGVPAPFLVPSP